MAENLYTNNLVNTTIFVDHVRCLHNQIQTELKKCAQLKKIIYKFTILSLSNGTLEPEGIFRIIVDVIYILAICDEH
jgi:hypothetical protein